MPSSQLPSAMTSVAAAGIRRMMHVHNVKRNAKKTDFGTVLYDSSTAPGVICDTLGFPTEFVEKYPKTNKAVLIFLPSKQMLVVPALYLYESFPQKAREVSPPSPI